MARTPDEERTEKGRIVRKARFEAPDRTADRPTGVDLTRDDVREAGVVRKAAGSVDRQAPLDAPADESDDTQADGQRRRAAGGRLVEDPDPRKKDPAEAEPLPRAGKLTQEDVETLDAVGEAFAEAHGPSEREVAQMRAEVERTRGESAVALTPEDVEDAQRSQGERILDTLKKIAQNGGLGSRARQKNGDEDQGDDHEQALVEAVADLCNVPEPDVRATFEELQAGDNAGEGDTDEAERELAEAVADKTGLPVSEVLEVLADLEAEADGGDGGATKRVKVAKAAGRGASIGSDGKGRAVVKGSGGTQLPLDYLAT